MASQTKPLTPSSPYPLATTDRKNTVDRPTEPAVPVYRHFLSGGIDAFQLTLPAMLGLLGISLIGLPLAMWLVGHATSPVAISGLAIATAAISLAQAVLVSRWAGKKNGISAGFLTLAGWTAACCILAPQTILAATAAIASILLYALAELSNRARPLPRTPAAITFYLAAALACAFGGITLLIPILAVCVGTVLANGNSHGLRFFASPVGLILVILGIALATLAPITVEADFPRNWPGTSDGFLAQWPGVVCLVLTVAVTWRMVQTGHAASPLGRLLICWLLAPTIVSVTGWISTQQAIAITLPAWAALAALTRPLFQRHFRQTRPHGDAP